MMQFELLKQSDDDHDPDFHDSSSSSVFSAAYQSANAEIAWWSG